MINHYPVISAVDGRSFGLSLRLPEEYRAWIQSVTDDFKTEAQRRAIKIQDSLGLDTSDGSFPYLEWDKVLGLSQVIVGQRCSCAKLTETSYLSYHFHNVETPAQALALVSVISTYLNGLQHLQEERT